MINMTLIIVAQTFWITLHLTVVTNEKNDTENELLDLL